jgi:hypothetical protein
MDSFDLYFLVREELQEWLDKETEALEDEIEELNSDLENRYEAQLTKAFECIKSGVIAIISIISLLLIGALLLATFSPTLVFTPPVFCLNGTCWVQSFL